MSTNVCDCPPPLAGDYCLNATGQCTVVIGLLHEICGLVTGCDMSLLLM